MPTYRLTLEYDGTRYHGWQEQKNARTVAGDLRRAVTEAVPKAEFELGGAGRTDAGVHALAQVAHLRLGRRLDPEAFRASVNEALPADVHLLSVVPEAERFHARHSAIARSYLYQISHRRTAFAKRFVWWVKRPLDTEPMVTGASLVEGRHDFAQFCERPLDQTSTVVVVDRAEIERAGALILVRLVASHFLWKMVRRIVGALTRIGAGEMAPGDLEPLLEGRTSGGLAAGVAEWTAPPSGLFLERVLYPGDPPLGPISPALAVPAEPPAEPPSGPIRRRPRVPYRRGR